MESTLIERFFARPAAGAESGVILGIGDDAALLEIPVGMELAVTVDALVEGVHFAPGGDPGDLGNVARKLMAVNLSDLAAMGATPRWATLTLGMPRFNASRAEERRRVEACLEAFSAGLFELADRFGVHLIGGDTTRAGDGALFCALHLQGLVPRGAALRRCGARVGDLICVTGALGEAGLALRALRGDCPLSDAALRVVRARLERPTPRVGEGLLLRGLASAAIDLSDGLATDLRHILRASGVGARLDGAAIPLAPTVRAALPRAQALRLALTGGEDYELCFTLPPERLEEMQRRFGDATDCPVAAIGAVESERGLRCADPDIAGWLDEARGYDHFGD